MLHFLFDAEDSLRAIDSLEGALARQMPKLLGDIGTLMTAHVQRDFLVKARGGTGEDGVAWPPLRPATKRLKQKLGRQLIGIRYGEMGTSFHYRVGGTTAWGKHLAPGEAIIENEDQPKANYFGAERPIIPATLPSPWYAQAEAMTQAAVDSAAAAALP